MVEVMLGFLERAGGAISLFAVAIIVVGFVLASGRYVLRWRLRSGFGAIRAPMA
jgi:hypothetical protein